MLGARERARCAVFVRRLRILPNLRGVRFEREPEADQVGLRGGRVSFTRERGSGRTHEDEDDGAVVRELDDGRAVEGVVGRADVLVVAGLARCGAGLARERVAVGAGELELREGEEDERENIGEEDPGDAPIRRSRRTALA